MRGIVASLATTLAELFHAPFAGVRGSRDTSEGPFSGTGITRPSCRRSIRGADHAGVERLSTRPRHAQKSPPPRGRIATRAGPADAKALSGTRALLGRQNQPPDGSRPLMRRYVTRLP
jgi:hypothetical protein